jgi:hypothetical protein
MILAYFFLIGPLDSVVQSTRSELSGIWTSSDTIMPPAEGKGRLLDYVESSIGLSWPQWEGGRSELEMADVNLDGNIDIVSIGDHGSPYINTDEHGVMVYFGDGIGRWQVEMSGNFGYGGIAIGDVNEDGLPDIGYAMHHDYSSNDFGDQLIEVALGDGTGFNWTPWDDGLATQGESYGMFATDFGDVDNDGDLDIAATSFGSGNPLMVYLNDGDGTWSHAATLSGSNTDMHVVFGDINRDGLLDVAASYQNGSIFFGNGDGSFYNGEYNLPSGGFNGYDGLSLGDVDNDGGMDLSYIEGGGIRVWAFDEVESLWVDYSGNLPASGDFEMTQLADMDVDGLCDVVAAGTGWVEVWRGDGNGNWTSETRYNISNDPTCPFEAFRVGGDADHNGHPDMVHLTDEGGIFNSYNHLRFYKESSTPQALDISPVFPRGGEVFAAGSARFIDWITAVPSGESAEVTVELSTTGGAGPWSALGEDLPDNGRLQWIVPEGVTSATCFLRFTVRTGSDSVVTTTPRPFVIQDGSRDVQVALYPVDPPIVIPPEGGRFEFDVEVLNNEPMPQSFNGWIMVTLPNGIEYGPVLGPLSPMVPPGTSQRRMAQDVPANAPPGVYTYIANVGIYPYETWDSDSFTFTKSAPIR